MTRHDLITHLERMRACAPSIDWLRSIDCETAAECWERCDQIDWMLWLIERMLPRQVLVGLACDYAERVLPIAETWLREHRPDLADAPREAIAAAREGRVTQEVLRRARITYYAAEAAEAAASASASVYYAAASASVYYADVDAADAAAYCAAGERAWQLAHTRQVVPWSMIEEAMR